MKLSEAIRLGSMMKPQGFGDFYITPIWKSNGPLGLEIPLHEASCALGAALDATDTDDSDYPDAWNPLVDFRRQCPQCSTYQEIVWDVIVHLNDDHRWTRERIADWVEQIEIEQERREQSERQQTDILEVESAR